MGSNSLGPAIVQLGSLKCSKHTVMAARFVPNCNFCYFYGININAVDFLIVLHLLWILYGSVMQRIIDQRFRYNVSVCGLMLIAGSWFYSLQFTDASAEQPFTARCLQVSVSTRAPQMDQSFSLI